MNSYNLIGKWQISPFQIYGKCLLNNFNNNLAMMGKKKNLGTI